MVRHGTVDPYFGRNGRVWRFRSLLGTVSSGVSLKIPTGDGVVKYGAVDLYWGRSGTVLCCGKVWRCRSLLSTLW